MTVSQPYALGVAPAETYRAALLRIVAGLFIRAGLDGGGADTLPRRAVRVILALLRPAEAAVRRLIVVAARDVALAPPKPRAAKPLTPFEAMQAKGLLVNVGRYNLGLARMWRPEPPAEPAPAPRLPAFRLTDPQARFDTLAWHGQRPFPRGGIVLANGDEEVDATGLCRRLLALKAALDDLPAQAKRLARWQARRAARFALAWRPSPLRPAWPPRRHKGPTREIDDILTDCHAQAIRALKAPDSS